jgi:hypothetical protein
VGGPKMVHAACWAHARRKFFEAAKLNPSDVAATRIVKLIVSVRGTTCLTGAADSAIAAPPPKPWV